MITRIEQLAREACPYYPDVDNRSALAVISRMRHGEKPCEGCTAIARVLLTISQESEREGLRKAKAVAIRHANEYPMHTLSARVVSDHIATEIEALIEEVGK